MSRRLAWANLPLRGKGLVVIAIPLLSLLGATALSYFVAREPVSEELLLTDYLQRVHRDLQNVHNMLQDAETGVRSFLLIGEKKYLVGYWSALNRMRDHLQRLRGHEQAFRSRDLHMSGRPGSRAASRLAHSIEDITNLDQELKRIRREVPDRFEAFELLVTYGERQFNADPTDDLPPPDLEQQFRGRVELTTAIRQLLKPIQDQLVALPAQTFSEQAEQRDRQLQLIVGVAVLGLTGGLLAEILFTRTISRRVERLEEAARGLATGRELPRLPAGRDEVGRLARELQGASVLLAQREQGLREAKEEADRANQAKSEFLSRMSHELRTPLNAILGFGQLLQIADLRPKQQQGADQIVKAGRHLLDLINEVLDIARVEAGRLTLSIEPVSVAGVVREAADLIRPLAAERAATLELDESVIGDVYVLADRQRFKQVLLNLLSNGVKYNRDDGSVFVSAAESGDGTLRIDVSDSGPGIPPDKIDRLFVPFDRLGADDGAVEGTGLGLALSKRLVDAMGGSLEVRSVVGEGSTFTVELKIAVAPVERLEAITDEVEIATDAPISQKSLLYVEDNLSNMKLVEEILAYRPGIKMHAAMQGGMGLDLAKEHRPDVILLDLDLPDMPGAEVLRRLRDDPRTEDIPVVIVTADATPGQMERLLENGAVAYFSKPLDVRRFLQVVDGVLREHT